MDKGEEKGVVEQESSLHSETMDGTHSPGKTAGTDGDRTRAAERLVCGGILPDLKIDGAGDFPAGQETPAGGLAALVRQKPDWSEVQVAEDGFTVSDVLKTIKDKVSELIAHINRKSIEEKYGVTVEVLNGRYEYHLKVNGQDKLLFTTDQTLSGLKCEQGRSEAGRRYPESTRRKRAAVRCSQQCGIPHGL